MKLIDLNPVWLVLDGKRIGFMFDCPTKKGWKQTCFFYPTSHENQEKAIISVLGDDEDALCRVQRCRPDFGWTVKQRPFVNGQVLPGNIDTEQFETISVHPSLDGSAGGLWHGYITNGQIIGGI